MSRKKPHPRCALALFLFVLGPGGLLFGEEEPAGWPRFRGPRGDGTSGRAWSLAEKPEELWTASLGRGNASLIVRGDRLYTVGRKGGRPALLCLDADTGKEQWATRLPSHHAESSPTLAGDRLYLLCDQGVPIVLCCEAKDGEVVWKRELSGPTRNRSYGHAGSPLVWEDLVIVNAGLGAAVERATGKVAWEHRGQGGLATPVLFDHRGEVTVMIFAGDRLCARAARTGKGLWEIPWRTDIAVNACDPIFHKGKVFLNTTYGKHAALFDVTADPPRQVWKESGSPFSSGFRHGEHLYAFLGGRFCCVDFATGERHWTGPHAGGGSALLCGGKILLLTENGTLYVAPASPEAFRPALRTKVHGGVTWTPPSFVGGKLFVRNKEGEALCLRIGKPAR